MPLLSGATGMAARYPALLRDTVSEMNLLMEGFHLATSHQSQVYHIHMQHLPYLSCPRVNRLFGYHYCETNYPTIQWFKTTSATTSYYRSGF